MGIAGWENDKITFIKTGGVDDNGADVITQTLVVRGRFEDFSTTIRTVDNEEVQTQWRFATRTDVTLFDYAFPLGADTSDINNARKIRTRRHARKKGGTGGHYEVFF